jgi:hypothetical protein
MLTLTIVTILCSILCGAVLGLRYKIFILLPAATFMLVFVIGVGVAGGAGIWRIALDMMVATTALQLGYAGGSAFAAARALQAPQWRAHHVY